ncbi:MAG: hypothetical protein KY475_26370, partial [Planctomycetes bacterium]|nr:hypothetical protein [Planctomycetota bacterium]
RLVATRKPRRLTWRRVSNSAALAITVPIEAGDYFIANSGETQHDRFSPPPRPRLLRLMNRLEALG